MSDTCNALVLSGGGSNGAWESGVLWGLINYGDPEMFKWDLVSGVSIGSITASALSVFPPGEEKAATDAIYEIWTNLTNSDVYKQWPAGWVAGLYKISLLDDSPGFEFVKNLAAPYSGFARHVSLSTVDIETGEVWNLVDAMESAEAAGSRHSLEGPRLRFSEWLPQPFSKGQAPQGH